jgi:hypothetical protein
VTVAVGSQLGSQLGYPGHPTNPSECPALRRPARDREVLASWVRSTSNRAGLAQRARIVLLVADGLGRTRSPGGPG